MNVRLLQRKWSLIWVPDIAIKMQIYAPRTSEAPIKRANRRKRDFTILMRSQRTYTELLIIQIHWLKSIVMINSPYKIHIKWMDMVVDLAKYTFFFFNFLCLLWENMAEFFGRCARSEKKLCNHNSSTLTIFLLLLFTLQFCAIWHKNDDDDDCYSLPLKLCAYAGRGSMLNVKYFIFSSRVSNSIESFRASLFFLSLLCSFCFVFIFSLLSMFCVCFRESTVRVSWFVMCQYDDMLGHTFYKSLEVTLSCCK